MKGASKAPVVLSVVLFFVATYNLGFAQEEMTMEEYKAQVQDWANRERVANDEIAKLDEEIESLQSQISDVNNQVSDLWAEIYQAIGTDEAGVNAFRQRLNDLDDELNTLGMFSAEELFKNRKKIDAIEENLQELTKDRTAVLTEIRDKIAGMEAKIAQLRERMPAGYDEYTVIRGDYLWKISNRPDIYGDAFQWIRIYSYNRDQVKDPDLIYPEQIFKIQRDVAPNEYLVSKGDNLAKITGSLEIMGDPTKWRALYEANKDIIGEDPGLIYPYQVLVIPR